jgi:pyruvate dehydrogenase E2 component (dihydrolipoamide acetyltransferase)
MAYEIVIPAYGPDIPEAEIVHWHVKEGRVVSIGDILLEIQADKAVFEIESPADGILLKTYTADGGTITLPAIIGYIGEEAEKVPDTPPTGPETAKIELPVEETAEAVPMSTMRSIIAYRMHSSKAIMPHFYVKDNIDMTDLLELRKEARREYQFKASVNDIILKAVALTLEAYPKLNWVCVGDTIHARKQINIAIAVALEEGLVTPVIRNINALSLAEIHAATRDLTSRTRSKKLLPHEYKGATFSVSNMGMLGVDEFSAIINPGESAILAVGNAVDTPVVRKGEIVIRRLMKMTLSSDHRLIDGAIAGQFLKKLKSLLEHVDIWKDLIQ